MGYANYILNAANVFPHQTKALCLEVQKINIFESEWKLVTHNVKNIKWDEQQWNIHNAKWPEWETDMILLSKQFPNVLFTLERREAESENWKNFYFINGSQVKNK